MFSKRILSSILCLVMLFSLCIPASAANLSNTGSKDVTVTYGMSEEFIVTIPGDFNLDADGKGTANVSASNVMISHGTTLDVTIHGHDYDVSWELIDTQEESNQLTYTIGSTDGGNDIINGSTVLSVAAGEAYNSTKTKTLYFKVIDELSKSGEYNDVLTFIAGIDYSAISKTGTASGTYLVMRDVASVNHELDVSLTSDTIDDFSDVNVSVYGSNLINIDAMVNNNLVDNGDSTYTFTANGENVASRASAFLDVYIPANTPFSTKGIFVENNTIKETTIYMEVVFEDGTNSYAPVAMYSSGNHKDQQYDKTITKIRLYLRNTPEFVAVGDSIIFKDFQLNIGEIEEYEGYIEPQIVTANTNGTVNGLFAVSPIMTIIANADVNINCNYKKNLVAYDLDGKTIVNFGDSIFGNYRNRESISYLIEEQTYADVYNLGFGGTRVAKHSMDSFEPFGLKNIVDSIISDDYSMQEGTVNDAGVPNYFEDSLELLKTVDFNNVDIVTIALGTNDFTGNNSLSNVKEAFTYSIDKLQAAYPNLEIVICSPTYRFWMDEDGNFVEDSSTRVNSQGNKLTDYIGLYEEIANEQGIYFIDNYNGSGINASNRTDVFPATDGTHPNKVGRQMIAEYMSQKLYEYFG